MPMPKALDNAMKTLLDAMQTGSIPVPRTNGPRTSGAIFEAALRRACALRVLLESAGLDVCSPPLGPLGILAASVASPRDPSYFVGKPKPRSIAEGRKRCWGLGLTS